MVLQFVKTYKLPLLLVASCLLLYFGFAYDLKRWDFTRLIMLYTALSYLSYKIISLFRGQQSFLLGVSLIFRLIFLIAIPNLSQDFYRFLWDGQLILEGINPYLQTPQEILISGEMLPFANQLVEGMGSLSASHYSNYPPVNQFLFALAGYFSKYGLLYGIIALRCIVILADVAIFYFGKKLLLALSLPAERIFWYLLNPFIIIELTGNLHFEGVMLGFLLSALYFLTKKKWMISAIFIGISISVKLIPLLLLPVLHQYLRNNATIPKALSGFQKGKWNALVKPALYYSLVVVMVLISFIPFYSRLLVINFISTTALWFQKFEFNASIYYLIRWIGYQQKGFNIIESAGQGLSLVVFIGIMILAFLRDNRSLKAVFCAMLFSISFYLLLATTVHPWYIATPALLCIFTRYRFPILWSALAMLSYSAYGSETVSENLVLVALEYSIAIGYAVWEISKYTKDDWRKSLSFNFSRTSM